MKRVSKTLRCQSESSGGFIIVGAVMFVLALTILGLSLFGLSSYEAQFLNQSADDLKAFYRAQSWMERSRYALSTDPHELIQVQQDLPDGVAAVAIQVQSGSPDSISRVEGLNEGETGEPVTIRVTATYKNSTRTLQAQFDPKNVDDYYKRVVTVSDSLFVNAISGNSSTNRCETVVLNGGIRLGSTPIDTSWVECLLEYDPSPYEVKPLPAPDVHSFFSEHQSGLSFPIREETGPSVTYDFGGEETNVTFYGWPESGTDFTFFENSPAVLSITGHNVWMLGSGFRCNGSVQIINGGPPGSSASLVIVSAKNGTYEFGSETYYDAGIWFFGGVETEVPLVLVSDGGVYIEQYHHTHQETQVMSRLSVYADFAFLTGPETTSGARLELTYNPTMNDLIDWLAGHSALPNASSGTGSRFAMIPGTWQEIISN